MSLNLSPLCNIINQLYALEKKVIAMDDSGRISRRFERIKVQFEELNLFIHVPLDEAYDDTRLDCDASVTGEKIDNLKIVEVIKPIIYHRENEVNKIVQRGVVLVEGR